MHTSYGPCSVPLCSALVEREIISKSHVSPFFQQQSEKDGLGLPSEIYYLQYLAPSILRLVVLTGSFLET